jgi:predicted nucleic acid-binding protein
MRLLFDTNIYDEILKVPGLSKTLSELVNAGKIVILQTHIQREELSRIQDVVKRSAALAIPAEPVATSGAVWDFSRFGEATFGDGSGDAKIDDLRSPTGGHIADALIGTTVAALADALVTEDKRLANRLRASWRGAVWSFVDLHAFVTGISSPGAKP